MEYYSKFKVKISSEIGKIFKDIVGRGPKAIKIQIHEDVVVIRFKVYNINLFEILKEFDEELLEQVRKIIFLSVEDKIKDILSGFFNSDIKEVHFSFEAKHEEAVMLFIFTEDIGNLVK